MRESEYTDRLGRNAIAPCWPTREITSTRSKSIDRFTEFNYVRFQYFHQSRTILGYFSESLLMRSGLTFRSTMAKRSGQ